MNIRFEINPNQIKIHNHTGGEIWVEMFNLSKNYCNGWGFIKNKMWKQWDKNFIDLDILEGVDWINIIDNDKNLHCYSIKNLQSNKIEINSNFDFNLPIICVTGASGGGTSVVTKSLRYFGAHTGDDSGEFNNRKTQESVCIRQVLHHIYPHIDIDNVERLKEVTNQAMFHYSYKNDKVNIFKVASISSVIPKMNKVFSNIKYLAIKKHKGDNPQSPEGIRFTNRSEEETDIQVFLPNEDKPCLIIDWNLYFTDYRYTQKVLDYVGLKIEMSQEKLDIMLQEIKFENHKLKSK